MFTAERTLYPFQRQGRDMMASRRYVLVVMHMGLGKTRTTIAAVERIPLGRGLVVCPSGVMYQWAREILATTDQKGLVIDGDKKRRAFLWQYVANYKYVIMSFGTMLADWDHVRQVQRDFLIVDEVTNIKGLKAQRSKAVKKLGRHASARFGLSGQPVENRPEELFSAMQFIDPAVFGGAEIFEKTFIIRNKRTGKVRTYVNLPALQRRLAPALYRKGRHDPDVRKALPRVVQRRLDPELDKASAALYEVIVADVFHAIANVRQFGDFDVAAHYGLADDNARGQAQGEVMARILALRMLCGDPELLRTAARTGTNAYATALDEDGALDALPEHGEKLRGRVEEWTEILEEDPANKIIVFSFFKPMLRIIQVAMRDYFTVIYDGDMTARQKDTAQLTFQSDPKCRMFLSSDAGGYGLNLKEAQFLDTYDFPWSAGATAQRETRNVRLDSTFESVVHLRGPVVGSIEEWMEAVVDQKMAISDAFIEGRYNKATGGLAMTVDSLSEFLENSAVR